MRDSMRSHTQLFAAGRQQSVIRWQPGLTKRRRGLASGERVSESFAMIGRCWVGLRFVHYINKLHHQHPCVSYLFLPFEFSLNNYTYLCN